MELFLDLYDIHKVKITDTTSAGLSRHSLKYILKVTIPWPDTWQSPLNRSHSMYRALLIQNITSDLVYAWTIQLDWVVGPVSLSTLK